MTLLQHTLETLSGRSPRASSDIGSGDWLFKLGINGGAPQTYSSDTFVVDGTVYDDLLGWSVGDYHEVTQDVDLTGMDFIVFSGVGQAPNGGPSGGWKFRVIVGGSIRYEYALDDTVFSFEDVKVPVSDLAGVQTISFRLVLV